MEPQTERYSRHQSMQLPNHVVSPFPHDSLPTFSNSPITIIGILIISQLDKRR